MSQSRKCNFCGIKKPLDEFDLTKSNSRQCNTCKSERRNDRISSNPLNYIQNLYVQLRYIRKKQGIPWEITPQQLYKLYAEQEGRCALTGQELTFKRSNEEEYDFNISIDRIDPSVGYYIENIQLIAKSVNFLKHDLPQEKFIKLIKLIYNNTNG